MIVTDALRFINGRAIVWVKNTNFADDYPTVKEKCGLIDDMGEFIVPPIYDNMMYAGGTNVTVNIGFEDHEEYQISGKWGVVDLDNHILIPRKYTDICPWENGLYAVEYQGKWGAINISEETIIPFEYDWLSCPDKYGWIVAKFKDKYGCIINREVVVPFIYDDITLYEAEKLIPVKYGQQAFYIDRDSGHRLLL